MKRILSVVAVFAFLVACSSDDDAATPAVLGGQGDACGSTTDCQVNFTCGTAKICLRNCKTRTDCSPVQQCCDSSTSPTKLECTDHAPDSTVHCTGG